jgi:phosphoribosylamine---glycine ligase
MVLRAQRNPCPFLLFNFSHFYLSPASLWLNILYFYLKLIFMNILLIGSGGREHAIAWKLKQSPKLTRLFIAPGNAGTGSIGTNIDIKVNDFERLWDFACVENIDMVIVGPEEPLVKGIHDFFLQKKAIKNIPVLGPLKQGAMLEGSKDFAKQFMVRHGIPTARYQSFTKDTVNESYSFLDTLKPPYVLKADGLAAGKGVLILDSKEEAKKELAEMFSGKFGEASKTVVIEEFLKGIELSVFVITDGVSYVLLPEAKDYKRVGVGDTGLNTGGMGAVSPVPFATSSFMKKVDERIIKPTVIGLRKDAIDYCGFIFFGLISVEGEPFVIEYNVRMGDPETEVVMPRIKSDLVDLFSATIQGKLGNIKLETDERTVTAVMLVSGGYPGIYENGKEITNYNNVSDSIVFHAGTTLSDNKTVTSGGRVMAISSYGEDIPGALAKSRKNAEIIAFEGKYFRTDIGFDLV